MTKKKDVKRWTKRAFAKAGATYCQQCSKFSWPTIEAANEKVEEMKMKPKTRKPYLLGSYRCPLGNGWHVGHNYKLHWISLCIGEHK